jgi:hypothetical protein
VHVGSAIVRHNATRTPKQTGKSKKINQYDNKF